MKSGFCPGVDDKYTCRQVNVLVTQPYMKLTAYIYIVFNVRYMQ